MLNQEDFDKIQKIVEVVGIRERNILDSCSELQVKAWLRSAVLGQTDVEIAESLISNRKDSNPSRIRYIISTAQLNILSNLFLDCSSKDWLDEHPELSETIQELSTKVREMRKSRKHML